MNTDVIEQKIEVRAPVTRVWRALTDYKEFGAWFQVTVESPFVPGRPARGRILYPGFEDKVWEAMIQAMRAPNYFSFTWHPFAIEAGVNYSQEIPTLVEFTLAPTASGTLVTVRESGFDRIPPGRRDGAFRANTEGWTEQLENIRRHVAPA